MEYSATLKSSTTGINELVSHLQPITPVHIIDTLELALRAAEFKKLFRGTVMYAVKCNPSKEVIRTLARSGIRTFDAASIEEVRLVKKCVPSARIHFMHTVKSREAIREAYFVHGVRVFVFDSPDELRKIIYETDLAPDLELYLRVALPKNKDASVDFSAKFGATANEAPALLQEARLVANRLGIMFHPGSQSRNPDVYRKGIRLVSSIIKSSGIKIDALDVGGGFPVAYPRQDIPALSEFIKTIHSAIDEEGLGELELYCEPGRAMVATSGRLIVRVELRKGNTLYLNDGVYGGLVETAKSQGGFVYPTRLIRKSGRDGDDETLAPFRFCGPTCDSIDMMENQFFLPNDANEGDWIEISLTGAYSTACRTNFNGFGKSQTIIL